MAFPFSHDTAIGGVGGTNSPIGGTLNNGVVNGYFSPASNGSAGTTPPSPQDNSVVFGNGFGSGINGVTGTPGGSASRGFGGAGGTGQSGIPGWSSNPIAINDCELRGGRGSPCGGQHRGRGFRYFTSCNICSCL